MKGRSVHDLLSDYELALERAKQLPTDEARTLREYHRFILSRQHILAQDPTQLAVYGSGQPEDGPIRRAFRDWSGLTDRWQIRARYPLLQPQWDLTIPVGTEVTALASCLVNKREVLFVPCSDGLVRRHDVATGKEILPPLTGHTREVTALCVLGDSRLASGSWDNTVRVWDTRSGKCLAMFTHDYPITALAAEVDPHGRALLVLGDSVGNVLFLDLLPPSNG